MKRIWTDDKDRLLRRHYPSGDLQALAARLGVTLTSLKSRAHVLHLHRKDAHRPWTERQLAYLRRHYATMSARELSQHVHHCEKSIYNRAEQMGLHKAEGFMSQFGHRVASHPNSIAVRFKKGHVSANTGKPQTQWMTAEQIDRTRATRFKPGQQPHNTKPVGYEYTKSDGYVMLKVEGERKMVLKHRYVWQQAHGPIPRGHNIMFRDGNRQNCSLDNLELVSRQEAARRQVQAETPQQRAARIATATAKRNKTIRRDKVRIHWGLEPKTKLVKRW